MTDDQIQQLLDRTDITDLKYAYARAADAGDAGRMVERFVADCTASYLPGQEIAGQDTLRDWYAQRLADVVSSSHHLSNVEVVFLDADTATLHAYLYSWQRFATYPDRPDRHCFARYRDSWIRTDDGWRQTRLIYRLAGELGSTGAPRIGEHIHEAEWLA